MTSEFKGGRRGKGQIVIVDSEPTDPKTQLLKEIIERLKSPDAIRVHFIGLDQGKIGEQTFLTVDSVDARIHMALIAGNQSMADRWMINYFALSYWDESLGQTGWFEIRESTFNPPKDPNFIAVLNREPIDPDGIVEWHETGGYDWHNNHRDVPLLIMSVTDPRVDELIQTLRGGHTNKAMTTASLEYLKPRYLFEQIVEDQNKLEGASVLF